mmetsp:Transcript_8173/g.15382  ORF Transcript_8173/g.15382 Transcript_8173/m.15382 type:complete len:474 (+) Transcript_8173:181-1602(+)
MVSLLSNKGGDLCFIIDVHVKQCQDESTCCLKCQQRINRSRPLVCNRLKAHMDYPLPTFLFIFTFVASMGLVKAFTWSAPYVTSTRILSFTTTRFKPFCKNNFTRNRRCLLYANVAKDPNQSVREKSISTSCEGGFKFPFPQMSIYTEQLASLQTSTDGSGNSNNLEHIPHSYGHHSHSRSAAPFHTSCTAAVPNMYENIFSLDLPEGKCVGLRLTHPNQAPTVPTSLDPFQIKSNENHWIKEILHPDEVEYGFQQPSESARITFFIGRLAMRTALAQMKGIDSNVSVEYEDRLGGFTKLPTVSTNDQSILKDEHGRPKVPKGFIGSISHKQNTAVALVSTLSSGSEGIMSSPTIGVGVDIEQSFTRRRNIAKKILTSNELNDLGQLEGVTRDEEVLLRFSLKESVYKAMHPLICQFVGFQEAEITPHNDGTATVFLNLKSGQHHRFKEVKAHWRRIDGDFFLTSASVTLKES